MRRVFPPIEQACTFTFVGRTYKSTALSLLSPLDGVDILSEPAEREARSINNRRSIPDMRLMLIKPITAKPSLIWAVSGVRSIYAS